jgi:hypothetical protein
MLPMMVKMNTESTEHYWQYRGYLVASNGAVLPQRCVKCNSTHDVQMNRKNYRWKPSAALLLGKASRLIAERESAITYGVCSRHRRLRHQLILATLLVLAAGFAVIGLAMHIERPMVSLIGLVLILASAIIWTFTPVLSPYSSHEGETTAYKGAGGKFLETLPQSTFNQF